MNTAVNRQETGAAAAGDGRAHWRHYAAYGLAAVIVAPRTQFARAGIPARNATGKTFDPARQYPW
jgi:hypothetical protein